MQRPICCSAGRHAGHDQFCTRTSALPMRFARWRMQASTLRQSARPVHHSGRHGSARGQESHLLSGHGGRHDGRDPVKANAVTDGKIITGCGRRRTGFRVRADYRAVRQGQGRRDRRVGRTSCVRIRKRCGALSFAERASLSAEEKQAIDRGIAQNILQSEFYQQADCIFCYVSTAEEIDTRTVLEKRACVRQDGLRAAVRQGRQHDRAENHRALRAADRSLRYPEPSDTAPEIAPENIDLILRLRSCDRKGYRLGYGGGYYDRFLSRTNAVCAALCASQRMSAALPHEASDRCCHYIITEREVLCTDESR